MGANAMINGAYRLFTEKLADFWHNLDLLMEKLPTLAPNDPAVRELSAAVTQLTIHQRSIYATAPPKLHFSSESGDELIIKVRRIKDWTHTLIKQSKMLRDELSRNKANFKGIAAEESHSLQQIELILASGLAINLLLSCLLVLFFQRHISSRVSTLISIAQKIENNENLEKISSSNDELGSVAKALVKASREISSAADYRHSLMQMMAHDLRSPLMASTVALAILEEKDDRPSESLKSIETNLNNCLQIVNDLLLLEMLESRATEPHFELENIAELVDSALAVIANSSMAKGRNLNNSAERAYIYVDRNKIIDVICRITREALRLSQASEAINISSENSTAEIRLLIKTFGTIRSEKSKTKTAPIEESSSTDWQGQASALNESIWRLIVENHGGSSGKLEEDDAFVFWFTLPTKSAAAKSDQPEGEPL